MNVVIAIVIVYVLGIALLAMFLGAVSALEEDDYEWSAEDDEALRLWLGEESKR